MKLLLPAFLALGLSACTSSPLYDFTVYGSPEPGTSPRFAGFPRAGWMPLEERGMGSPTSLKLSLYSFYLSTTPNCAAPVPLIDYGSSPLVKELYARPTLFSGNPGTGTYHCVVLRISDTLKFKVDAAAALAAACAGNQEFSFDGYRADQGSADTWKSLSGQVSVAHGAIDTPSADVITLFITTNPSEAMAARGLAATQTLTLAKPISVPGNVTLFSNFLGSVVSTAGICSLAGGLALGLN